MRPHESRQYWNGAIRAFVEGGPQTLWRSHSDQVNTALLSNWLNGRQFSSILKTDLFDEALSPGLYPLLRGHASAVHGVDIAGESVAAAKARYPEMQTRCADVRKLPFADNSFDVIASNSTLDHFQSTDEIDTSLQELFRVLKGGGELLITLDNLQNPIVWLRSKLSRRLLNRLHLVPYFVGQTHARPGLVSALERAGFGVLETRAIMHCPRVLAVAVSTVMQDHAPVGLQQRFLAFLNRFECLAHLPTRYFTGYFVAARAVKPRE